MVPRVAGMGQFLDEMKSIFFFLKSLNEINIRTMETKFRSLAYNMGQGT